ncbi:AAA family ATPase [Sinorhizobium medicae]|nr:AAA family ATPase [Sinorhizobium medicae]
MGAPPLLKRRALPGAFLRSLGHASWAAEQTASGINFLGGHDQAPFSAWAGPARLTSTLGFTTIAVPLAGGRIASLAGVTTHDAAGFISSANAAFRAHILRQCEAVKDELSALSDAVSRLDQPRRYPAACLLAPFLMRATAALDSLPATVPDGILPDDQQKRIDAVRAFQAAPDQARRAAIARFIDSDLAEMKVFFDTIEKNPLTPEQRLAVVTDEDATLVLAGAGSGKTSVIVAKAAYLIARGIRKPNDILLLAFGKDAASEMAARIEERAGVAVDAMTFHALGNRIIREVEGTGPALADHASDDAKFKMLLRDILINEVASTAGLGKLLLDWFSEFYWPYKSEWDFKTHDSYYQWVEAHELRTLNGDRVRSFEEWEIANWLYRNGIAHEYEPLYDGPLPEDARGAYKPDFRLTESGIYIEHFGVRKAREADGSTRLTTAPYIPRERYLADMEWKRNLHKANGTTLIETFSYEKVEGKLLDNLKQKLPPHVTLKPVATDQVFSTLAAMGQVDAFTQTLGTFLRHYKSAGATIARCEARATSSADAPRSRSFLKIFDALIAAYEARLGDMIDFEDMIVRATAHVESGRYQSPYRHILVDEFQDISEGRARLLRALKAQHEDARLFAVGDDWQSIYRFTGADIHLMRNFGAAFGGSFAGNDAVHSTIDLGRTFRSVDKIAHPARRFVLRNPAQISKTVVPAATTAAPAIMLAYYKWGQEGDALRAALERLSADAAPGTSVLLLGRYHHARPQSLAALTERFPTLSIRFMTVHASKGLEGDHVIILRAVGDTMGFPSEIVDDPLLDLVLPEPENFEHAEERRLFYVALTRARHSVTILADREKPSSFVRELAGNPEYEAIEIGEPGIAERRCQACGGRMLAQPAKTGGTYFACEHRHLCGQKLQACSACGNGLPVKRITDPDNVLCSCGAAFPACPSCADGWLVERQGRNGTFLGCVNYPACKGTQNLRSRERPHALRYRPKRPQS